MKNNGITLIALIVTIIVIIILAGVGISMITGDNSTINRAEEATYKNSITTIEQWLNEFYVEHYDELPVERPNGNNITIIDNKLDALIEYFRLKKDITWADKKNTNDTIFHYYGSGDNYKWYENDAEGHKYVLINSKNLQEFAKNTTILEFETNYKNISFAYGVTNDLKVYIIMNGMNDLFGLSKDELSFVENAEVIFNSGSAMSKLLNGGEDTTFEQIKSVSQLDINNTNVTENNITSLDGVNELKSLKNLTISDVTITNKGFFKDLDGTKLEYIRIKNSSFEDYEGLDKCINLTQIELILITQDEFDKICKQMKNAEYTKLAKFGVFGDTDGQHDYQQNFTDERYCTKVNQTKSINNISEMANFKDKTKKAIKYLWLCNNRLEDINALSEYTNIIDIRLDTNNITSLSPLKSFSKLRYVRIPNNKLTTTTELENSKSLYLLDVRKNPNLSDISNVKNLFSNSKPTNTSYPKLWFTSDAAYNRNDSDENLNVQNIIDQKNFLIGLKTRLKIGSKYSQYLIDYNNSAKLEFTGNINKAVFEDISECKKLTQLSLKNVKIVDDSNKPLSSNDVTTLLNSTIPKITTLEHLQLYNVSGLNNISSFDKLSNLIELDLRQCANVTNIEILNKITTLEKLSIDNSKIQLTSIQPTINRLGWYYDSEGSFKLGCTDVWTGGYGLLLCNESLYYQLSKCTDLERLVMYTDWERTVTSLMIGKEIDLSGLKKLTYINIYRVHAKFKMPSSLTSLVYSNNNNANADCDLKLCTSLTSINFGDINNGTVMKKCIESLPDNNNVITFSMHGQNGITSLDFISTKLKKLTSFSSTGYSTRIQKLESIDGICNLPELKTITISYASYITKLPDMSNLKKLEKLSITYSGLTEVNIESKLSTLPNLKRLILNNNKIANIYGLMPQENQKDAFKSLYVLNLKNNNLYNESQYTAQSASSYKLVDSIFIPLRRDKSLKVLNIAGNANLTEKDALKNYTWENDSLTEIKSEF